MYTGNANGLYRNQTMSSPQQGINASCLGFYYNLQRPHEYSSTYFSVRVINYYQSSEVLSLMEYRTETSMEWRQAVFSIPSYYQFNLSFVAGGHRSLVAIDDVFIYDGDCGGLYTVLINAVMSFV